MDYAAQECLKDVKWRIEAIRNHWFTQHRQALEQVVTEAQRLPTVDSYQLSTSLETVRGTEADLDYVLNDLWVKVTAALDPSTSRPSPPGAEPVGLVPGHPKPPVAGCE
jgi:hypothetical protein